MSKAEINIQLYSGEDGYGSKLFRPGETVRGAVTIYPNDSFNCKNLYARLIWHTQGRGTRFLEKGPEMVLFQGDFMSGMPQTYEFQLPLPEGPWSYDGHYISTVWKVEVQLDVSWARDPKEQVEFLLRPAGG